jgi:shikimate kinase
MGSGKTSVSKALAQKSGFTLIDTDQKIEEMQQTTINQIFSTKGETHFRQLEEELCESLLISKNSIISTGGGLILSEKNQNSLKKIGLVIYLEASVNTIVSRIKTDTKRPLFNQKSPHTSLSILLNRREPIYKKLADLTITTDLKSIEEIADTIWSFYNAHIMDTQGRKVIYHDAN